MSKSIRCTNCGKDVNLKEALYKDLKSDFDNNVKEKVESKTKDLHKQISSLTSLMEKYMSEAGEARAKTVELNFKLQNVDKNTEVKINERLEQERKNIDIELNNKLELQKNKVKEQANLKVQEKLDVIEQLKKQLEVAAQKASQGSMQAQGEAQEVLIEDYLKTEFPLDNISEVKKGAMGADSLQIVNTRNAVNLGTIYYESKRTKVFNIAWLEKFKKDMRERGADIGVIVSAARPTMIERASTINGVWVCSLEEFKILSKTLRGTLISIHAARGSQENKGEKMEFLYNYLISNEFKMQVDAIIEGFSQMQTDLDTEKRAMLMSWNKREKQIKKVIDSTASMYGSIKGIGGDCIQNVPSLQLGELIND